MPSNPRALRPLGKLALALLLVGAAGGAWFVARTPPSPREPPASAPNADPALETDVEERRLLNGAEAALARGDSDQAFSLLYEHATKFPKGKLTALRQVVHIRALCHVGKAAEAREEAASFLAQSPASPLASQVRNACAAKP